ncbi:MAG: hypothetical protein AB8H12_06885 [Lewinella sp.]
MGAAAGARLGEGAVLRDKRATEAEEGVSVIVEGADFTWLVMVLEAGATPVAGEVAAVTATGNAVKGGLLLAVDTVTVNTTASKKDSIAKNFG